MIWSYRTNLRAREYLQRITAWKPQKQWMARIGVWWLRVHGRTLDV
jgi:hypothetical protein